LRTLVIPAVLAACLLAPAAAQADVLITAPQRSLTTSGCIGMGFFYQSYSGGPRAVNVSVYYKGQRRVSRRIIASTRWRDHMLYCPGYPNAGKWYTRVSGADWSRTYTTRVRIDRD